MSFIGFSAHNHENCIQTAIHYAEEICAEKGLKLTTVRRRVLEILLSHHKALGAYEILEQLQKEGFAGQPPLVYRSLDFLVKNRLVHKVEKMNAFVACAHPNADHDPAFLICRSCNDVAETLADTRKNPVRLDAKTSGFQIESTIIEVEGLCPSCQGKS